MRNNKAILTIDDKPMKEIDMTLVCYESSEESINIDFTEKKGFSLSIVNRNTNIMNYYSIVDGKPVLTSREDILTGNEIMMRDDIRDRIFEIIKINFTSLKFTVYEKYTYQDMDMSPGDMRTLAELIATEFDIEEIPLAKVMAWTTVGSIVSNIENILEGAGYE